MTLHSPLPLLIGLTLLGGLVACGGGVGESSQDGVSGQEPDPVVVDFPLAYVVRPLPRDEEGEQLPEAITEPDQFRPGAHLYLQERATATAGRRNLTAGLFEEGALYDVKDLSVHPDGDRLLFALRAPEIEDADDDEQPTWNIWEYELESGQLRRVIPSDLSAEAGQDLSPRYLADGRILFSSTRQNRSRAILLDDGKPQFAAQVENDNEPALVLHTMESDGRNVEQISYNQSHDLQPSVMPDGRLLLTRWDGFNQNRLSLYTLKPDGTDLAPHYGYHSLNDDDDTPTLFRPRVMADGRVLAIRKPRGDLLGGDLVAVDIENYVEDDLTVDGAEGGPARVSLASSPIPLDVELSRPGLYHSAYPLYDGSNRLLVSWSQCRLSLPEEDRLVPCTDQWLETEGTEPAPPLFGLWIFDPDGPTQQPVVVAEEGRMVTEPVALEPRARPDYLEPAQPQPDLESQGVGILHIRSVYDLDGEDSSDEGIDTLADPGQTTAAERPARFLRLLKAVSRPDNDTLNDQADEVFGNRFNQNRGLLEILGYVPIEPDGSVMARVPADVALSFEVLDAEGERIGRRHNNWLQLRPGEERHCQGCHSADSRVPHGGRADPPPAYEGAATSGQAFLNTRRTDAYGSPEYPEMGETMAQFDARIAYTCTDPDTCAERGPREPSVNIHYTDHWTDPAVREPDPERQYLYSGLAADDYREYLDPEDPAAGLTVSSTYPPATEGCQQQWSSQCRVVINYENHIQPLWERQRLLTEENEEEQAELVLNDGNPIDHTCTGCHTAVVDDGREIPLNQLDLSSDSENVGTPMVSYQELLNNDFVYIINPETETSERLQVETGEFECEEPDLRLDDEDCTEVPITEPVPIPNRMSRNGAAASGNFFARFEQENDLTDPDAVDHRGMLNPNELRLLREWLDTGARYYNNPFDRARQDEE